MDKKGRKILHKTLAGFLVSVMLGTTAVPLQRRKKRLERGPWFMKANRRMSWMGK